MIRIHEGNRFVHLSRPPMKVFSVKYSCDLARGKITRSYRGHSVTCKKDEVGRVAFGVVKGTRISKTMSVDTLATLRTRFTQMNYTVVSLWKG